MRNMRNRWLAGSVLVLGTFLAAAGCLNTTPDYLGLRARPGALANAVAGQGRETATATKIR